MEYPDFRALDVETTMNGDADVGLSHPMHPKNYIVAFSISNRGKPNFVVYKPDADASATSMAARIENLLLLATRGLAPVFVGQNISFDLLYLYKLSHPCKELLQKGPIWDIQLAEYLLTAQTSKFASLDEMCVKYLLPTKDSKVSEYFKGGHGADKVPRELLLPYLDDDINNTLAIANIQYEEAYKRDMLPLIWSQMEALHATTEMIFNGLHVDTKVFDEYTTKVVDKFVELKLDLEATKAVEDIDSSKQWCDFFFGGTKKIKVKEEVGTYKNGKTKFKLVEKEILLLPHTAYTPTSDKRSEKTGRASVDEDVLSDIKEDSVGTTPKVRDVASKLLEYRGEQKQLSTYVSGLRKHLIGSYIHGNINHAATGTGRLSSSNPNLQNVANNLVKQIFTSRWPEGVLVEVDFNQLEVAALACVTNDDQLIYDISHGVDIHSRLYKGLYGRDPTKEERKPFKSRTFQLIYGAGANAIAKQAKCSIDEAKKFIKVFYDRYPKVLAWHLDMAEWADKSAVYYGDPTTLSLNKFRSCHYKAPTGRVLKFNEYYNDKIWATRTHTFSPTELKNYPIQSLATGDIVPHMLGILFRRYKDSKDVKMVNTIHDSILFDVKASYAVDFMEDVLEVLRNTHNDILEHFKYHLPLKLNASASYGYNWFDTKDSEL